VSEDAAAAPAEVQRRSYESATRGLRSAWPEEQAMDAERLREFLGRRRYGVLATSRRDGRAHAAPVAFTPAGGAFWIATVAGLRLRNLRAVPWASLVVMEGDRDDGATPHVALTAEGPVVLHEGEALEAALQPLQEAWIARHGRPPDWAAALIELTPERLFSYRSG
jgi:hypothetical protein